MALGTADIQHCVETARNEALEMRVQRLFATAEQLGRVAAFGAMLAKLHADEGSRLHHRPIARRSSLSMVWFNVVIRRV
ncbi:MAG: hypothetical protein ING02_02845 [Roseomonas sp.]|nr:hypothetical protein [Roseomonas sp.]